MDIAQCQIQRQVRLTASGQKTKRDERYPRILHCTQNRTNPPFAGSKCFTRGGDRSERHTVDKRRNDPTFHIRLDTWSIMFPDHGQKQKEGAAQMRRKQFPTEG
jgi:hypothetical protein